MKHLVRAAALAAIVLTAQSLQAGIPAPRPVPTLGEAGLLALAVSLAGGGAVLIRRRRR